MPLAALNALRVPSAEAHFIYFKMAQITHGSYFNIAPMDIVERLFDFWLLIIRLLFQSIVISRSEHGELPPRCNGGPCRIAIHMLRTESRRDEQVRQGDTP